MTCIAVTTVAVGGYVTLWCLLRHLDWATFVLFFEVGGVRVSRVSIAAML